MTTNPLNLFSVLKPRLTDFERRVMERAVTIISEEFGVTLEQLRSKTRLREYVNARCALSYLLYVTYNSQEYKGRNLSLSDIGAYLGGRDHATIHSYVSKVHPNLFDTKDPQYYDRFIAAEQRFAVTFIPKDDEQRSRLQEIDMMMVMLASERRTILKTMAAEAEDEKAKKKKTKTTSR